MLYSSVLCVLDYNMYFFNGLLINMNVLYIKSALPKVSGHRLIHYPKGAKCWRKWMEGYLAKVTQL